MPYPSEHAARLLAPSKFDKFRRTNGGKLYNKITIPKTIDIIWGHIKGKDKDAWAAQSLRFDKNSWTVEEAKKWLKDNEIKFVSFEPASDKEEEKEIGKSKKSSKKEKAEEADQNHDHDDNKCCDNEPKDKSFSDYLWMKEHKKIQYKIFSFDVSDSHEEEIDGCKYGIVEGYASTYGNIDRGNDIVEAGAFTKSINEYRSKNQSVPMHFQHSQMDIIGDFPSKYIEDQSKGLFCKGIINLEVQRGRETYALLKQGALRSFSIGFTIDKHEIKGDKRHLKELSLWEISVVAVPMNAEAEITAVKGNQYQQIENKFYKIISAKSLEELKKSNLEKILRKSGMFTRQAAKYLVSCLEKREHQKNIENKRYTELRELLASIRQCDAVDNRKDSLVLNQQLQLLLQELKN